MFEVKFDTGNAAFDICPEDEICAIIEKIEMDLHNGETEGSCIDFNGNKIGEWKFKS